MPASRFRTLATVVAAALALLALAILAGRGAGERGVLIEARDPAGGVDQIRVDVGGEVAAPGVYVMQPGDRIGDAVVRAGGATAEGDLAPLNLARRVADEDSIRVPRRGDRVAALDLNTATGRQLEALPGIGPVRAAAILEARAQQPFSSSASSCRTACTWRSET
jgi:competence protein ComEA